MADSTVRMDGVAVRTVPPGSSTSARWILVACVVAVYAFVVFASEKIEFGHGLGWDGQFYGQWARDGQPSYQSREIPRYYISRSFPPLAIHQVLLGLNVRLAFPNVIRGFEMMNILLVFLAAWCWTHIADRLAISQRGRWLGAVVLFANCSHLKISAFCPVLMDEWAFSLAMLQLLLFIDRRPLVLAAVTAVGAFCWPTVLYTGVALIGCMPSPRPQRWLRDVDFSWVATAIALAVAAAWGYVCWSVVDMGYVPNTANEPIVRPVVRLSIAATVAAAFAGLQPMLSLSLLPALRRIRQYLGWRLALAAVLLVGVTLVQRTYSYAYGGEPDQVVVNAVTSIQKPALFLLAHIIFFGPIILVSMIRWRDIAGGLSRFGPGLAVALLGGLFLFLNSESRRVGDAFAFVTPFAIKVLDDRRLSSRFLLAFAACTVFFSKVWLLVEGDLKSPELSEFPSQWYFMNHGPWISMPMYLLQSAVVIPVAFWLWHVLKKAQSTP